MKNLSLVLLAAFFSASFQTAPPKIKLPKAYVFVPSGTLVQDGKQLAIAGFFMQATEVSNLEYREFLAALEREGRTADLETARIRTGGDSNGLLTQTELYPQHPAYENYPVVNVSREAVQLYCAWLQGVLQTRYPEFVVQVRLPAEMEWVYAAQAGQAGIPYPHGYYLRDSEGKFLYNFRRLGDESLHRNPATGAIEVRTDAVQAAVMAADNGGPGPARSNAPNAFGLFNMSGNVAEMLAEPGRTKGGCFNSTGFDIRIDAADEFAGFTGASPFIGFRPVVSVVQKAEK